MRGEGRNAQTDQQRPHQQRDVDIGRHRRHPHAQQHRQEHRDEQSGKLKQHRPFAAQIKGEQEAEYIHSHEFRQAREVQANVDHCHREEHQIQRRHRDARIRQCVQRLARGAAKILVQEQQRDDQRGTPPPRRTGVACRILVELQEPGQLSGLTKAIWIDRGLHAQHPAQRAATDQILGSQQQDQDQQDWQEDLQQVNEIIPRQRHVWRQLSVGFDALFA